MVCHNPQLRLRLSPIYHSQRLYQTLNRKHSLDALVIHLDCVIVALDHVADKPIPDESGEPSFPEIRRRKRGIEWSFRIAIGGADDE